MKYLVLFGVLLVVYLIWRGGRGAQRESERTGAPPAQAQLPQDMVSCPVCSVHLPRADALPGPDGRLYCCQDHRAQGGG